MPTVLDPLTTPPTEHDVLVQSTVDEESVADDGENPGENPADGEDDNNRDDDDDRRDDDGDGDNDEPWLTIATFWEQMQAHLARLKLESEEIDCFLLDENLVSTDWLMANAVGGIKLQVRQSDAAEAAKILALHSPAKTNLSDEPIADGQTNCPRCGSDDIGLRWGINKTLAMIGLLLAALPLGIPIRRWTCRDCGFRW